MLSSFADEPVKAAIVEGLRLRDMDVVTAQERDQRQVDDEALLAVATGEGRLLLTNDTDFLRIHSRWLSDPRDHAGIVLAAGPRDRACGATRSSVRAEDQRLILVVTRRSLVTRRGPDRRRT